MKVKYQGPCNHTWVTEDLKEFLFRPSDYCEGELERMKSAIEALNETVAALLTILVEKKMIEVNDAARVVGKEYYNVEECE